MKLPLKEKLILIVAILIFLFIELGVFSQIGSDNVFLAQLFGGGKIKITTPNGGEKWSAGKTYQITWKTSGIDKVGIVLFKGQTPSWIAKNISAKEGKYDWEIPDWQEPSQDYKIAIFEYPWQKGNKIDYSDEFFTISGSRYASCDTLSISAEWPYLASDIPNLRKVFITTNTWKGDLGGLEGADEKCQTEAKKKGFSGTWKALLGDDQTLAIDRLKLDGIFVEAEAAATVAGGNKTCHRLLGENFEKFLEKFSTPWIINREKLSTDFLKNLSNVWVGRITDNSPKECIEITKEYPSKVLAENYSFTTTCKNWTSNNYRIPGYPPLASYKPDYPKCYTSTGKRTDAVGMAGLSIGLTGQVTSASNFSPFLGKSCDTYQKLICLEQ